MVNQESKRLSDLVWKLITAANDEEAAGTKVKHITKPCKSQKSMRLSSTGLDFVSAWVTVEGENGFSKSSIYDIRQLQIDGIPCAIGRIASKDGQRFQVHMRDSAYWRIPHDSSVVELIIDGLRCSGRATGKYDEKTFPFTGYHTSESTERDFMFSKVIQSEEDDALDGNIDLIGTIVLCWYKADVVGIVRDGVPVLDEDVPESEEDVPKGKEDNGRKPPPEEQIAVDEQHKAGEHHVIIGEERAVPFLPTLLARKVGDPFATFAFQYAPIEILLADGYAPHPSTQGDDMELKAEMEDGAVPSGSSDVEVDAPSSPIGLDHSENISELIDNGEEPAVDDLKEEDVLMDLEEERRRLALKRQEIDRQEEELKRQIESAKQRKRVKVERDIKTENPDMPIAEGEKMVIDLT